MHEQTGEKQKIAVLVGPTASGKTALAVTLAEQCNGEVVSADSRQVYRGLDIGTDKATEDEMHGVRHHLIDVADPRDAYTAADFLHDADTAIADISARGKLPVVAGGTFFYIDTLLGRRSLAGVSADPALRVALEILSTDALYERLTGLDPALAERTDAHNRRRLIRAIEIRMHKDAMPPPVSTERYHACIIGLTVPLDVLGKRIDARLNATLARGLVAETENLLSAGVPEERLNEIGLEYRVVLSYLRGEYTYEEMRTVLTHKVRQYAKRQRTWLKKMPNVHWIPYDAPQTALALMKEFCGR